MFFLKIFWGLVQILFLVAIGLWLYFSFAGEVQIAWGDYILKTHAGAASALLFSVLVFIIFFSHLVGDLVRLPKILRQKLQENKRTKGQQALMRALSAASLGDYKNAYYLAHRAQKFLPEQEQGLSLLLQAHAANSEGKEAQAISAFEALVQTPDTSVLGVQGLLQKRVMAGDVRGALELAKAQTRAHPKNFHLLKPVYDLEKRNELWNDALLTLEKLQRYKIVSRTDASRERAVLWIILGDAAADASRNEEALKAYQKAYSSDESFAPSVLRLARLHAKLGQRSKAVNITKRALTKFFHPSLVALWAELKPQTADLKWFMLLQEFVPNSVEVFITTAIRAIELNLWGEAKAALMKAEKIDPCQKIYTLWVKIEEQTTQNSAAIRQWLDRVSSAPQTQTWICRTTLQKFDDYTPIIHPQILFNTLEWGRLDSTGKTNAPLLDSQKLLSTGEYKH